MLTDEDIIANLPAELRRIRRNNNPTGRHIFMDGMLVGKPEGYLFDSTAPHTYCRICGTVYQTQQDRDSVLDYTIRVAATLRRKRWAFQHASTHSMAEHNDLIVSGRYMTPEAANKLVPLGVIPISDMIFDTATEQAAAEAPRLLAQTQDRMEEIRDAVL
jgi:hypothetical protein